MSYTYLKLYMSGAVIEACYDIFLNEIIEYDMTNEEPAGFNFCNYNSNYRQNTLPINIDPIRRA